MATKAFAAEELPPDNAARIAIYDALPAAEPADDDEQQALSANELFDRVISRLRVLVPRELFVHGECGYVQEKVKACTEAGLVKHVDRSSELLTRTDVRPRIRYPDGTIRDYDAGLEAARERLEADDAKLRQSRRFDVHQLVRSLSDDQDSDEFRALVASLREHGYLEQFPVSESADGLVVDGRARVAAAAAAHVTMLKKHRIRIASRRDTPLHHALLVLDANWARLSDRDRQSVYDAVAEHIGRSWTSIEEDLALTREWRVAEPRPYVAKLDVKKVKYRPQDAPKIQVTRDGSRVMLRSLLEAAGLASYKYELLEPYVAMEDARTAFSGRTAIFVGIADVIGGIATMQRERRKKKLKTDKEWNDIWTWLVENYGTSGDNGEASSVTAAHNDSEATTQTLV